jgi:hypothetical protein
VVIFKTQTMTAKAKQAIELFLELSPIEKQEVIDFLKGGGIRETRTYSGGGIFEKSLGDSLSRSLGPTDRGRCPTCGR